MYDSNAPENQFELIARCHEQLLGNCQVVETANQDWSITKIGVTGATCIKYKEKHSAVNQFTVSRPRKRKDCRSLFRYGNQQRRGGKRKKKESEEEKDSLEERQLEEVLLFCFQWLYQDCKFCPFFLSSRLLTDWASSRIGSGGCRSRNE